MMTDDRQLGVKGGQHCASDPCEGRRSQVPGASRGRAGVLALNYADLAWEKGRPLGTCSLTCRRDWGTQLAARSAAHS